MKIDFYTMLVVLCILHCHFVITKYNVLGDDNYCNL